MIECYEGNCKFHLRDEPFCGEAECLNPPVRDTEVLPDDFVEETPYDLKGVKGVTREEKQCIQQSFDFGGSGE